MQMRTTSTQRTYRYVRLSLVGVIVFLGVAVTAQIVADGPLASVSEAFYTPARDVFTGSLCAVALALLVLSGRSVEQALLDLAALFAPVIALVPSPVTSGEIAGMTVTCPGERSCVPESFLPGVALSILSLVVIGILGIVTAAAIAAAQGTLDRALVATLAVATVIVVAGGGWWMLSPPSFVRYAHDVAAVAFFALFAVVAVLAAWRPAGTAPGRRRGLRIAYGAIAAGILASLVVVTVAVLGRTAGFDLTGAAPLPLFFLGEAAALVLFAAFWVVQTVELWSDPDPRLRAGG